MDIEMATKAKEDTPTEAELTPAKKALGPRLGLRSDGGTKVFWRGDERDILINETAAAWVTLEKPNYRDALTIAQEKLPKGRQRNIANLDFPSWLREGVPPLVAKLTAKQERDAQRVASQAVEKAQQPAELPEALPALPIIPVTPSPMDDATYTAVAMAPTMMTTPISDLREQMVGALTSIITESLARAFTNFAMPNVQPALMSPPTTVMQPTKLTGTDRAMAVVNKLPQAPKRPTVLVVGLTNTQKVLIERDYAEHFDLRFVGPDESKEVLRQQSTRAETVLTMVDHISHAQVQIIKARNVGVINIKGGVTALREFLSNLKIQAGT